MRPVADGYDTGIRDNPDKVFEKLGEFEGFSKVIWIEHEVAHVAIHELQWQPDDKHYRSYYSEVFSIEGPGMFENGGTHVIKLTRKLR